MHKIVLSGGGYHGKPSDPCKHGHNSEQTLNNDDDDDDDENTIKYRLKIQ